MIIITENSTSILLKHLEIARDNQSTERCFYIRMRLVPNLSPDWLDQVSISMSFIIDDGKSKLYICEDGDVFAIAFGLTHKKMADVYTILLPYIQSLNDLNSFISLHEFMTDINMLLVTVQDKMNVITDRQLAIIKQAQEEARLLDEKKQRAILEYKVTDDIKHSIAQKKSKRETFEILLVDDDLFSTKMVDTLLGKLFTTHKANTAWEAITTYMRTAPDILFLDIDMPVVNGHEILTKILELDPKAHIIMLSGHSHQDNIKKSIQSGAKGFVTKPFTKDRVFQYIQQSPQFLLKNRK